MDHIKLKKLFQVNQFFMKDIDDYWRGKPALKTVVLKVVAPGSVVGALEKGEIDLASVPADQYLNAKELANIELLAKVDTCIHIYRV